MANVKEIPVLLSCGRSRVNIVKLMHFFCRANKFCNDSKNLSEKKNKLGFF